MIPTFNCVKTLPRTIESVLSSATRHAPTQIEIVDDSSSRDNPEEVANSYRDHGVRFYRQPRNVGATNNFNTCIARAEGEWVHILHGDDYVDPDFYSALSRGIETHPNVSVAFTSFVAVDESGASMWSANGMPAGRGVIDHAWRDVIAERNKIMAPAIVVRKKAYEEAGGFATQLCHTADWDMWKRLIWRYDAYFEPQVLAYYLVHSASDTSSLMRSATNLFDSLHAIKIGSKYFPTNRRNELVRKARRSHAYLGLDAAKRFFARGDYRAALRQVYASTILAPEVVFGPEIPRRMFRNIRGHGEI
jgi:glycosyltransferase involved in cell wall biosynthesis